jgi:dihydroorotase
MITITNATRIDGIRGMLAVASDRSERVDASGMLLLPGLIDPHVHFRVPGGEHKEDWKTAAQAAIAGGVTTVLDMPNNTPACITRELLEEKRRLIDAQLKEVGIPLRYGLYLGASERNLSEIENAEGLYVAVKVFLGQSTGDLLMSDPDAFADVCRSAASRGAIVAVHAEDERTMQENKKQFSHDDLRDVAVHSKIRGRNAAIAAMTQAIATAKRYGTKLYILHASTKEEVELVRAAKRDGVQIALETTPHHLFLNEHAYATLGTKAQMNPPLRTPEDQDALWEGLRDGTIDTIGTDHAPHTLQEKAKPYGEAPSGVPGIETLLPLLLSAHRDGKISLERIVAVTRTNAEKFFRLEPNDDVVLVDMETPRTVMGARLKTKCAWSPFEGRTLVGWPVCTITSGRVFRVRE